MQPVSSSGFTWSEPPWLGSLESPYDNEPHRKLQSYVRSYVDENILPYALEWEAQGDCPEEAKAAWISSGLPLADIPAKYKPPEHRSLAGIPADELDAFHSLILSDQLSRFEGGVNIALSGGANPIGLPPVLHHGTEEQRRRWVPGLFTRETNFCLGAVGRKRRGEYPNTGGEEPGR